MSCKKCVILAWKFLARLANILQNFWGKSCWNLRKVQFLQAKWFLSCMNILQSCKIYRVRFYFSCKTLARGISCKIVINILQDFDRPFSKIFAKLAGYLARLQSISCLEHLAEFLVTCGLTQILITLNFIHQSTPPVYVLILAEAAVVADNTSVR